MWRYGRYSVCYISLQWAHISLKNKRITRAAIQTSLGIGETWMSDALGGSELAHRYGQGGPQESRDVVHELQVVRLTPLGRSTLLRFLQDWEKSHPMP